MSENIFQNKCGCEYNLTFSGHVILSNAAVEFKYCPKHAAVDDLLEAAEAISEAVNNDPSLQEELIISSFGDDDGLPFAKAIRQLWAAIARARDEA